MRANLTDKQRDCLAEAVLAAPEGAACSIVPRPHDRGLWSLQITWKDGPTLDELAHGLEGGCRPAGADGRRRWKLALTLGYGSATLYWLRDRDFAPVQVDLERRRSALTQSRERVTREHREPLDDQLLEVAATLVAGDDTVEVSAAVEAAQLLCGTPERT